jgi:Fe-S cluster assembly protein SufD
MTRADAQIQVEVAAGVTAAILDSYQGVDGVAYTHQLQWDIRLGSEAVLHYYKLQDEGDLAIHESKLTAEQGPQSQLSTYHVMTGAATSQEQLTYVLSGERASCRAIGFYDGQGEQHSTVSSHVTHAASHTESAQQFKGVARAACDLRFQGNIEVPVGRRGIVATQQNHYLSLSPRAKATAQPELTIDADDVSCAHGATIGQLDEESLFYLCSRGIPEPEARALLVRAFYADLFDCFADQQIAADCLARCYVDE